MQQLNIDLSTRYFGWTSDKLREAEGQASSLDGLCWAKLQITGSTRNLPNSPTHPSHAERLSNPVKKGMINFSRSPALRAAKNTYNMILSAVRLPAVPRMDRSAAPAAFEPGGIGGGLGALRRQRQPSTAHNFAPPDPFVRVEWEYDRSAASSEVGGAVRDHSDVS